MFSFYGTFNRHHSSWLLDDLVVITLRADTERDADLTRMLVVLFVFYYEIKPVTGSTRHCICVRNGRACATSTV